MTTLKVILGSHKGTGTCRSALGLCRFNLALAKVDRRRSDLQKNRRATVGPTRQISHRYSVPLLPMPTRMACTGMPAGDAGDAASTPCSRLRSRSRVAATPPTASRGCGVNLRTGKSFLLNCARHLAQILNPAAGNSQSCGILGNFQPIERSSQLDRYRPPVHHYRSLTGCRRLRRYKVSWCTEDSRSAICGPRPAGLPRPSIRGQVGPRCRNDTASIPTGIQRPSHNLGQVRTPRRRS